MAVSYSCTGFGTVIPQSLDEGIQLPLLLGSLVEPRGLRLLFQMVANHLKKKQDWVCLPLLWVYQRDSVRWTQAISGTSLGGPGSLPMVCS